MGKQRVIYIDILRAFAIILVVMGHLLKRSEADNEILSGIIYSFHMPLFMSISGFVSAYTARFEYEETAWSLRLKDTGRYIGKKFAHIMIPFLLWLCVVHPFFFCTNYSLPDYPCLFRHMFIINDSLWFLPCLFGLLVCFALYRLGRSWCKKDSLLVNLLVMGVIFGALVSAYVMSGWDSFRSVISYFIPFFIGVFMGQYPVCYNHMSNNENLYSVGMLVIVFAAGIYLRDSEALCGKISRMICGCASIPLCFYWFRNREWNPYLGAAFSYIGRNTMIIYILHSFWDPKLDLAGYHFPIWVKLVVYPALSMMMIVPILGVNLILEQSAFTRRWLLGRK